MALQPFDGFLGGSYERLDAYTNTEMCMNFYPELVEGGAKDRSRYRLRSTPGFVTQSYLTVYDNGPVMGLGTTTPVQTSGTTGPAFRTFAVIGHGTFPTASCNLWEFSNGGGTPHNWGSMSFTPTNGPVRIIMGTTQMAIIANLRGQYAIYVFDFNTNTLSQVTVVGTFPNNWPPVACDGDFQDGYFVFAQLQSQIFFISSIGNALTYSALDFALENDLPDTIMGVRSLNRRLWLFGKTRTQVWYNSGAAGFPFTRDNSATIEIGAVNATGITKLNGNLFWLARDAHGAISACKLNGYSAIRISTASQEAIWNSYPSVEDVQSDGYHEEGHQFFRLRFPSASLGGQTWVWDDTAGLWHQRGIWNATYWGSETVGFATYNPLLGGVIVGDINTSGVYQYNRSICTVAGNNPIRRQRTSAHIFNKGCRNYFNSFVLDVSSPSTANAQLRYSDDFGKTYSAYRGPSANPAIAEWTRLGSSRQDRVFDLVCQDNVNPITISGAYIEAQSADH